MEQGNYLRSFAAVRNILFHKKCFIIKDVMVEQRVFGIGFNPLSPDPPICPFSLPTLKFEGSMNRLW